MTGEQKVNSMTVNIGDRTAIIAAGIAIGITLISAPGLYSPMSIPIGLALMVTLHAADSREDNNRFQSASFALAWALTFLLFAGLFLVNPYITEGQVTDHFTHFEVPAVGLIKHTFGEEASDIVSCFIVS